MKKTFECGVQDPFLEGCHYYKRFYETMYEAWTRIRPVKLLAHAVVDDPDLGVEDNLLSLLVDAIDRLESDFHDCAFHVENANRYDLLRGKVIGDEIIEGNKEAKG